MVTDARLHIGERRALPSEAASLFVRDRMAQRADGRSCPACSTPTAFAAAVSSARPHRMSSTALRSPVPAGQLQSPGDVITQPEEATMHVPAIDSDLAPHPTDGTAHSAPGSFPANEPPTDDQEARPPCPAIRPLSCTFLVAGWDLIPATSGLGTGQRTRCPRGGGIGEGPAPLVYPRTRALAGSFSRLVCLAGAACSRGVAGRGVRSRARPRCCCCG